MRLTDERGRFHGRAFYSDKSQIAVRLLTREDIPVDRAFFTRTSPQAAAYRQRVVENTDAYRLVYSEARPAAVADRRPLRRLPRGADPEPGHRAPQELFVEILVELFSPKGILERNDPKVRLLEGWNSA